jgi:hypothetical protein
VDRKELLKRLHQRDVLQNPIACEPCDRKPDQQDTQAAKPALWGHIRV